MYTCHTRLINCSNRVRLLDKSHSNKAIYERMPQQQQQRRK